MGNHIQFDKRGGAMDKSFWKFLAITFMDCQSETLLIDGWQGHNDSQSTSFCSEDTFTFSFDFGNSHFEYRHNGHVQYEMDRMDSTTINGWVAGNMNKQKIKIT